MLRDCHLQIGDGVKKGEVFDFVLNMAELNGGRVGWSVVWVKGDPLDQVSSANP